MGYNSQFEKYCNRWERTTLCEWRFQFLDSAGKIYKRICAPIKIAKGRVASTKQSIKHTLKMGELAAQRWRCPEATGILFLLCEQGLGSWIDSLQ